MCQLLCYLTYPHLTGNTKSKPLNKHTYVGDRALPQKLSKTILSAGGLQEKPRSDRFLQQVPCSGHGRQLSCAWQEPQLSKTREPACGAVDACSTYNTSSAQVALEPLLGQTLVIAKWLFCCRLDSVARAWNYQANIAIGTWTVKRTGSGNVVILGLLGSFPLPR